MTRPRALRRLDHIADDIRWLRTQLPTALTNLQLTTPDGYPHGGDYGWDSGGEVARPTEHAAITRASLNIREAHLDALTAEIQGLTARLCAEVRAIGDPGVDTTQEAAHSRCSGGEGNWARPECQALAVKTRTVRHGVSLPLCAACIQAWRRDPAYALRPDRCA